MVASTNAPSVPALAIEQPSPSCHGVARPAAVSGLAGTVSEQFSEAAASAAVWLRLMAAPVPSTGAVATSPSCVVASAPPANELAGGTVVPVLVVGLALAVAVALVVGLALAVAVALAVPDAVTEAVGVGKVLWWCLQNDALAMLSDPPFIVIIVLIVTPIATGMAIAAAIRARRLL